MAKIHIGVLLICSVLISGCQSPQKQQNRVVGAEYFNTGPKLVKILLQQPLTADSLLARGMDLIVVQPDYVIARIDAAGAMSIRSENIGMSTFEEFDLVQRLIAVTMRDSTDLAEIGNTGVDIWEVRGDTVIAQAFDKYIRDLEASGYEVVIVEKDIRNLVD